MYIYIYIDKLLEPFISNSLPLNNPFLGLISSLNFLPI